MEQKRSDNMDSDAGGIDRRGFLRAAGGSAGAVAASSGVASAAGSNTGFISELIDCLDTEGPVPERFPHITENGDAEGNFPDGPDELAIYINGFASGSFTIPPLNQAYAVSEVAKDSGYEHPVAGFTWGSLTLWFLAKQKAMTMGEVLAGFLDTYKRLHPDTEIHLIGHSLGSRVVGSALQNTEEVSTATVLGAAIPRNSVSRGGEFHDALSSVDEYHSYYSRNDAVLGAAYNLREFGTVALGYDGAMGETPANYVEHDASDLVDSHCDHIQPGGTVTRVVDDVLKPSKDGKESGSDETEKNGGGSESDGGGWFSNLF